MALLERTLTAALDPDDAVLDPFCGCSATVHAAQSPERLWGGTDVTHPTIGLIENRL